MSDPPATTNTPHAACPNSHPAIHVAVTRRVKPGCEKEFEAILRKYVRDSIQIDGMTGVHMILPSPGSKDCEYGILRSFENDAAMMAFYASELFVKYEEDVEPLVNGPAVKRNLHGLEAFFRVPTVSPPARWKMAFVTWLGVVPVAFFWSSLLGPHVGTWPRLLGAGFVNAFVVGTLVYIVMPRLTEVFRGWLHSKQTAQTRIARS